MIWDVEKSGKFIKGKVIVEFIFGNIGIVLVFIVVVCGYKLILMMFELMLIEWCWVMVVFGVELIFIEVVKGMFGVIVKVKEIVESDLVKYFMFGQFDNFVNFEIYFKIIGFEIWNDCDGVIDVFVVGVGIGGIIIGVFCYIKNEVGKVIEFVVVEFINSLVIIQIMNGEVVKFGFYKIQGIGVGFIF